MWQRLNVNRIVTLNSRAVGAQALQNYHRQSRVAAVAAALHRLPIQ